jgi:DNA mismatch endonuclease (patch repair protein)
MLALTRSEQMSRIRGVNTKPEVALRDALSVRGLAHDPATEAPAGRPDVLLTAHRVAVFVDGCFWHGCPIHYARPRSREDFWSAKLVTNLDRDARLSSALNDARWRVIRLWEHEIVEDADRSAGLVEQVVHGAVWDRRDLRRVRRVTSVAEGMERRELVLLGDPGDVVDVVEGPRITAKARALSQTTRPRGDPRAD